VIKQLLNFGSKTIHCPVEPPQRSSADVVGWSRRDVLRFHRSKSGPDGQWQVRIDTNHCSDCAACTRICKTSALQRSKNNQFVVYTFDARRCDGCGDCRRVCVENALIVKHLDKEIGTCEIARLPVALCSNCSRLRAAVADGLCIVCRLNGMRIGENNRTLIQ